MRYCPGLAFRPPASRFTASVALQAQPYGRKTCLKKGLCALFVYCAYVKAIGGMEAGPRKSFLQSGAKREKVFFPANQKGIVVEGYVFCAKRVLHIHIIQHFPNIAHSELGPEYSRSTVRTTSRAPRGCQGYSVGKSSIKIHCRHRGRKRHRNCLDHVGVR